MKKLLWFVAYVIMLGIACLSILAFIGIAAQAPGTSQLIMNNF